MNTPVVDFLRQYPVSGRFHMPGHKGKPFLGCEALDITEVAGADNLYAPEGILAESEANAARLFGAGKTLYSTEGSSQCIRAMLALACRRSGVAPVVVAARNVHKAFVYACGLLDIQVRWLWPEAGSLCSCPLSPAALARRLDGLSQPPAAVYLTSPDYLGGQADIAAMAQVCHQRNILLLVDNAHGAYLHWLDRHPLDLGADMCCDSAHKTLPVLTGGAYLHLSRRVCPALAAGAKAAMAMFGSTSPSYLTLASLDLCNQYLADGYAHRLAGTLTKLSALRRQLTSQGWRLLDSDPLRLTVDARAGGLTGHALAQRLAGQGLGWEYASDEHLVLMVTPENQPEDCARLCQAMGQAGPPLPQLPQLPPARGRQAMSIRKALLSSQETLPVESSPGRVCAAPAVSCPPAVPVAVSGEVIGPAALALFRRYGIREVAVVAN